MTQFLPPNLLALFAPRDPIPYLPPPDKLPHEKKNVHNYQGIAAFVEGNFENDADTPPPTRIESREERMERKKREKEEQVTYKLEQAIALWDPQTAAESTTDPFRTLFVARINFYTSESKLRREFETYGPIKQIKMITDQKTGKPRGYCFIEFEHEKDMHSAYKHADGKKIDGRRVLVDVERARTVKGWLPRSLGGGLGGTRRGGPDVNVRHSGREEHRDRDRGDRDRERRKSRSRSRDRERRRRRSKSRDKKRSRRSRSRSRPRRDRSRSRDRKRSKRSRSKDRDRSRRDRDRKNTADDEWSKVRIKDEPEDGNDYYRDQDEYAEGNNGGYNAQIKTEQELEDRKPFSANGDNAGGDGY
eukprot:11376.XXX_661342_663125_1 [CDS] Oithona nana genome sequencing.